MLWNASRQVYEARREPSALATVPRPNADAWGVCQEVTCSVQARAWPTWQSTVKNGG